MYKEGKGTEADPVKAQYWYEQAAATPEARAIAQDKARTAQEQTMFNLFFGALSAVMTDSSSSGHQNTRMCHGSGAQSMGEYMAQSYVCPN